MYTILAFLSATGLSVNVGKRKFLPFIKPIGSIRDDPPEKFLAFPEETKGLLQKDKTSLRR